MDARIQVRNLPHWNFPGAVYFVTACLAGSIPARGLLDISRYRASLLQRPRPEKVSLPEWELRRWKLVFARRDEWLDLRPAVRYLADERLAKVVQDALYHFAGERYDLLSYVVMPSHIHWVFRPRPEWEQSLGQAAAERSPRERILHGLKRHCALEGNRLLDRQGAFWQDESYDHCPRDEDELERIIHYVEENPVKAGFVTTPEAWPFSSAKDRREWGLEFGQPLLRPLVGQVYNLSGPRNGQVINLSHKSASCPGDSP